MNAKGIVLRKIKYRDYDLIVAILTMQGERLDLLARSALRSKKRFGGGVLEPTHYIEFRYMQKEDVELGTLNEAGLLYDFAPIRKSYDSLQLSFYFLKLVLKISKQGDCHSETLFNLLGNALRELESAQNLELLKVHFESKILAQQGFLSEDERLRNFYATPLNKGALVTLSEPDLRGVSDKTQSLIRQHLDFY